MTQEDKGLLLKDLCARLPYGVIVRHADCIIDNNYNETGEFHYTKGYLYDICRMDDMTTTIIESEGESEGYEHICDLERSLPYLRPMSSMTKEEIYEFQEILGHNIEVGYGFVNILDSSIHSFSFLELQALFDWLNARHFDYRGLIDKGLALEVSEEMYR